MADGSTVELVGAPAAMRDLRGWADQLAGEVDRHAPSFAGDLAQAVRDEVPVLTGTLAASVEAVDLGDGERGAGVQLGDGVPYAGWIEFGGSHGRDYVPEGRYLYPTARDHEEEWRREAEDIADSSARSYPWSTPSTV